MFYSVKAHLKGTGGGIAFGPVHGVVAKGPPFLEKVTHGGVKEKAARVHSDLHGTAVKSPSKRKLEKHIQK